MISANKQAGLQEMVSAAIITLYVVLIEVSILTVVTANKELKDRMEKRGISVSPLMILWDIGKVPRVRKLTERKLTKQIFLIAGLINFAALLGLLYWQVLPSMYNIFNAWVSGGREVSSPFIPVIPGLTISVESFLYILLALSAGVALHEFFHALAAYSVKWRVEAWGVGLFLIFPLAYVKPSEEDYNRASLKAKATVLTAGVLANTILFLIAVPLLPLISSQLTLAPTIIKVVNTTPSLPAVRAGIPAPSVILSVNKTSMRSIYDFIKMLKPYQNRTVVLNLRLVPGKIINGRIYFNVSDARNYLVVKPAWGKIGIYLEDIPTYKTSPVSIAGVKFLYWFEVINISLGLINAAPLYISDGGRLISDIFKGRYRFINHLIQGGTAVAITVLLVIGLLRFI